MFHERKTFVKFLPDSVEANPGNHNIFILENSSSHHSKLIGDYESEKISLQFLPSYSPDKFN